MTTRQKRSAAGKLLLFVAILVAIVTILSVSASYISPAKFWIIAFFGLPFVYIYPLNFFFLFYYAFRKRNHIIMPLIACISGLGIFLQTFNFTSSKQSNKSENNLKILSYNVRLFDLYNWSHNIETREKMISFLVETDADVNCFQEYYTEDSGLFNNTEALKKALKSPYFHYTYPTSTANNTRHWGIITFSKYPIVNAGEIDFGKKLTNSCIYIDLLVNSDTIRVYNTHLESIRFKKKDYEYVKDIKENVEEQNYSGFIPIIKRLRNAFVKRAAETDLISNHIKNSPYKTILCGDFNDTPSSYSYHSFSNILNDSFKNGPFGFSTTYNGVFPAFRIDYILHSPQLISTNFKVIKVDFSDHFPVLTEIIK